MFVVICTDRPLKVQKFTFLSAKMGQTLTTQEKYNIKREIYTLYPGLEQQLEMAFSCHDLEGKGVLPYTTLEPVIRHLLMQYGLIEYVTRFSQESGRSLSVSFDLQFARL